MTVSLELAAEEWDVIVVGGGPPGENAAQYATQFSSLEAVIVERELLGGECSYWACMPSKALLRPVELRDEVANVPGLGGSGRLAIDTAEVLARRDRVVNGHDDASQVDWASGVGIAVVRGHGRLGGPKLVQVRSAEGTRVLRARHAVVLDTGSRPFLPPVRGLADARPWTSRDVTNLHEVPRRVVVIGGGVVACESATWLSGLGAEEVTLVERGPTLLPRAEPFVGEMVAEQLRARGVDVRLGAEATVVLRPEPGDTGEGRIHGGEVRVTLGDGASLAADELVVAAGRLPNSADVGLERVGLVPGAPVPVDDHFEALGVGGGWLYAVGDVCGRAQLTHMGKYQARVAGEVIAARAASSPLDTGRYSRHADLADHGAVPQVTFTSPPVASVGRTESEARRAGLAVATVEYDLANLAGTHLLGEGYAGRAKLVVDPASRTLLGATFVGAGTTELVHSATVALVGRVPLDALWHAVPSYPTVSEVWLRLLETLDEQERRGSPS